MNNQFCLKWNNHQSTLVAVMKQLLSDERLTDVTLLTEGSAINAHRVVLSACSSYFEKVFSMCGEKHCVIVLKDVSFSILKSLLEFMYNGEVNVAQDQLPSLIKTAENLSVKGLADNNATKNSNAKINELKSENDTSANPEIMDMRPNESSSNKKRRREKSLFIGMDDPLHSVVDESSAKRKSDLASPITSSSLDQHHKEEPVLDGSKIKKENENSLEDDKDFSNYENVDYSQTAENVWEGDLSESASFSCDNSTEGPNWSSNIDPNASYMCDPMSEVMKDGSNQPLQFQNSDNSVEGKKSAQKQLSVFYDGWLFNKEYRHWIAKVPNDNTKYHCILCDVTRSLSNMGARALDSHAKGVKHRAKMSCLFNSRVDGNVDFWKHGAGLVGRASNSSIHPIKIDRYN